MFPFIQRDLTYGIIYDGNIKGLDTCYNSNETFKWFSTIKENGNGIVEIKEVSMVIYGTNYKLNVPVFLKNKTTDKIIEEEDVSEELYKFLVNLATHKQIDDVLFGIRQKFLEQYKIFKRVYENKKTKQNITLISFVELIGKEKKNYDTVDEQATIIMMKEYIDGFINTDTYTSKVEGKKIEFPIGQEYEITIPGTNEKDIIKGNFNNALRHRAFIDAVEERKKRYFLEEDTSLLYQWQYDLTKRMGKRTIFTNIRRSGKSIMLSFYTFSFMLKKIPYVTTRPIQVLFVGLDFNSMRTIMKYLQSYQSKFGEIGDIMFKATPSKGIFRFMSGKKTISEVRFITDTQDNPGVGDNADLVIIDEVARISEGTWDLIKPFILNQNAQLIAATTMYKSTKKSWIYKYLAQYERNTVKEQNIDELIIKRYTELRGLEKGFANKTLSKDEYIEKITIFREKMDNRFIGIRYTIDDNVEMFNPTKREQIKKETLEKDPEGYFSELYSRFSDEGKVFKYNKSLVKAQEIIEKKYQLVVVSYDPARSSDTSALVIMGFNQYTNKIVLLEEHNLNIKNKSSFILQSKDIKDVIKKAEVYREYMEAPVLFTMDGTHPGVADVMRMNGLYPYFCCIYTGGKEIIQGKIDGEYKVPKQLLVEGTKNILRENGLQINMNMEGLTNELDNFYEIDTNKYEGVGAHDDFVNAMMIGLFYIYEILGKKYLIMKPIGLDENKNSKKEYTLKEIVERRKEQDKGAEQYDKSVGYFSKFIY